MTDQPLPVVILAGGRNSPEMEAATGVVNRALVPLGQTTMLDYVVRALCATATVGSLFVVGDVPPDERYQRVSGGKTLMDNLMAGLRAIDPETPPQHVLVATSDTPFLNPRRHRRFHRTEPGVGGGPLLPDHPYRPLPRPVPGDEAHDAPLAYGHVHRRQHDADRAALHPRPHRYGSQGLRSPEKRPADRAAARLGPAGPHPRRSDARARIAHARDTRSRRVTPDRRRLPGARRSLLSIPRSARTSTGPKTSVSPSGCSRLSRTPTKPPPPRISGPASSAVGTV